MTCRLKAYRLSSVEHQDDKNFKVMMYNLVKTIVSTSYAMLPAAGNRNNTDGTLNNRGNNGNYWSSTENSTNAYNLNFNSSNVNPANSFSLRTYGFTVRCIAE